MTEIPESDEVRWQKWEDLRRRQMNARTDEERAQLKVEEEALRDKGIADMLKRETNSEPMWMWLSFRDVTTDTNLGVAIVEAGGIIEATHLARKHGCNPGGEVLAYKLSPENLPAEEYRYRLLSEEELEEAGLA